LRGGEYVAGPSGCTGEAREREGMICSANGTVKGKKEGMERRGKEDRGGGDGRTCPVLALARGSTLFVG
jgi:hypothetical protein